MFVMSLVRGCVGVWGYVNYLSIYTGLRCDQRFETKPEKFEGIMMKRRKWPLKGWHKVSSRLNVQTH